MKRYVGFSTLVALCLGLIGSQIGCQSGWKISNPFASHPRASSAEAPEELDALGEMGELTPPPENYTVGDASKSNGSESLAQKGKYEVEDKASEVEKIESETRAIAEKTDSYKSQESYQVADYSQSYQTDAASATDDYSTQNSASVQSYAQTSQAVPQSNADAEQAISQQYHPAAQVVPPSYAQTSRTSEGTAGQEYAQTPSNFGFQAYSAPVASADVATNAQFGTAQNALPPNNVAAASSSFGSEFPTPDFPAASSVADNSFPTANTSFPTAQNTNVVPTNDFPAASFNAAPSSSQPVRVALNPEPNVAPGAAPTNSQPATYSTGAANDSDPYSNVYYAPQTTSAGAGFAPGSASGLY